MEQLKEYRKLVIENLNNIFSGYKAEVASLYAPVDYALEGGKKIRPVSVLMSADVFDGDLSEALTAAFAVEMFHNFTLLHDDVMDKSVVRRNRPTVHSKWDVNQAILSGDAMMILVYQKLLSLSDKKIKPIMELMNKTALEVCEGQQLDMEFETTLDVSIEKYLLMIKLKTAVLLACSLSAGAIIADATPQDIDALYQFGLNIGLAFQLQDDYFDTFADFEVFGKKIGNDIITNKKTFLLINALQKAKDTQKSRLEELFSQPTTNEQAKIDEVKNIYNELKIPEITQKEINNYYEQAINCLDKIQNANPQKKQLLYDYAEYILKRKK